MLLNQGRPRSDHEIVSIARNSRALAPLLALAVGCAALPWPTGPARPPSERRVDGLVDLRGVVHVHTRDSHDSPGQIGDLVEAARSAGVSWVALTEHTRPGAPAARGRVRGVTLIPGYELRAFGGSVLALGVDALPQEREPIALVRAIHAAGGLAFLGHFERVRIGPDAYAEAGLDGVEIANLHANAKRVSPLRLAARGLFVPGGFVLRPLLKLPRENLSRWDALRPARTVVGGVDAHAKLRAFGPLGGTVDSYARVFRLLTTHVLARDASRAEILDALRAGRSYVALEGLRPVDAFEFERVGDTFEIAAPARARLVLLCDGTFAGAAEGDRVAIPIPRGADWCRAEALLDGKPWIVTSYRRARP